METNQKTDLLSKFFTKNRIEGDKDLDRLFELDDYWNQIYGANRIGLSSFSAAQILANKSVIEKVLSSEYK